MIKKLRYNEKISCFNCQEIVFQPANPLLERSECRCVCTAWWENLSITHQISRRYWFFRKGWYIVIKDCHGWCLPRCNRYFYIANFILKSNWVLLWTIATVFKKLGHNSTHACVVYSKSTSNPQKCYERHKGERWWIWFFSTCYNFLKV